MEYLIKNANKNFHQAANKAIFQKRVLNLLRREDSPSNSIQGSSSHSNNSSDSQRVAPPTQPLLFNHNTAPPHKRQHCLRSSPFPRPLTSSTPVPGVTHGRHVRFFEGDGQSMGSRDDGGQSLVIKNPDILLDGSDGTFV